MKRTCVCVAIPWIAGMMALSAVAGGTYVEYVDSDYNNKAVINTGYFVNPKTRIALDYAYHKFNRGDNPSQSNLQQRAIGLTGGSGSLSLQQYINGSGQYAYSCTNNVNAGWWYMSGSGNVTQERVLFTISIPDRYARLYRNGSRIGAPGAFGPVPNTAKYPLGLFASKANNATTNAVSGYGNFATVRLWSLKIWEGGTLVRDYRPYKDENGTYCLKERISGHLHYTVENKPLTGGAPIDLDAEESNVVTLAPGYNVTTNVSAFGGDVTVRVNESLGTGGIVNMDPYNFYSGPTYLNGGTLVADNLLGGSVSSLGGAGTLYMDAGTLKYTGTGTFNRDIVTVRNPSATGTNDTRSVIFDVTGDLTLAGKFTNPLGGFVKTGPGTLRIPGGANVTNRISAIGGNGNLEAVTWNANGDSTIHGSAFELLEGTLVLGEKGGVFYINGNGADAWIGKVCVDPRTNPGVQEKSGVLEVRGGTVINENWLMIGVKNGFEETTPNGKPQSGIRVYGGTFEARTAIALGRNKTSGVHTDAGGNKLKLNTAPFLEVHGGTMRLWNGSRVSLCDDPGADSRVWVDGGTLVVRSADNTTGSEMIVGNCQDGDKSLPSVADVTVCSNGTFDVTGFRIVNTSRASVTANINVLDGGRYRNNQLYKGSSNAGHALNILFDGGIAEIRYAGYANYIKSDVTKGEIGTRGALFRAGADCSLNVIDSINITFQAKDTHPDEEPQGVTIGTANADRNSGFRFTVPQAWAGPTRILADSVCELTGTGAFPAASDVTLETKGTLTVAADQTFASFTVGTEGMVGSVTLGFTTNATITAQAFEVKPNTALAVNLFATMDLSGTGSSSPSSYVIAQNATPVATPGTYTLLTVPAAAAADLTAFAQNVTVLNPAADTAYAFGVTSGDGTASLTVTVAAAPTETVAAASGETTNVVDAVTGDQTLKTNPTATGGGMVDLGGTLAGFGGRLVSGSGTTTISDLSFVGSAFDWVVGPGTLWYTGAATAVPGLTVDAGANTCGELKIDNDVTIGSAYTLSGSVCKSGAGDLILQGNGYFSLGSVTKSWATNGHIPQPNGDGRTSGFGALNVSEGRIVVGTKNDPSDAPTIDAAGILMVGMRTTETAGETETTGEFVMNNGVLTLTSGINIGYYNGLPTTTPEGVTLRPKLTLNGGTISCTSITLGVDGATGEQTCSPELEVNGGELIFPNNLTIGNQSASEGAVNRITVNDGVLSCKDINFGWAGDSKGCAPGIFEINGGEVRCNTFVVGNKAVSGRQELYLNGGVLKCARIAHAGVANATAGAGSAAVYFRGTTVYPGYNRTLGVSYEFGGTSASSRMEYYVGAAGIKFDFTEWVKGGDDNGIINFRNPVQHDPECAGEDGGIWFKGSGTGIRTTVVMRGEAKGCSFNGPVRATDGAMIGVDNGWTEFVTKKFEIGPGSGLRSSPPRVYVSNVTLGEANATEPVLLDFAAGSTDTGLVVSNELAVLSPVIVGFHRNGGASNVYGSQNGSYPVLIYPASLEGNVPLSMFVANPELPESSMTFTQESITSGAYSGWRMVKVTVGSAATVPGTTWTGMSGDGKWTTGGNWDSGAAPDGRDAAATFPAANAGAVTVDGDVTAGRITLNGGVGTGYTFTGNAPKLEHTDIRTPPAVVAESGEHVFANGLATDDFYLRCNETDAYGYTGAIGVYAKTGSKVTINGPVATDPKRPLYVNNPTSGGGTTVLNAPVSGTGVTVNSGTLEFSDATILDGKKLTVGPGTVHYTGNGGVMSADVAFSPGVTNRTATIRTDGDLTIAGLVTTPTQGAVMKTGPGTLRLVGAGTMKMGSTICNVRWNSTDPWPTNGDSIQNGNGSFCLDEGDLVVGGPGQTLTIGGGDVFIGSQPRGWSYTTDRVSVTILGGTISVSNLGICHGMRRVDGSGNPVACYVDWNQYGGTVNVPNVYAGYELTAYDNHATVNVNLYGGRMNASGSTFRFGQTYRKANTTGPDPHTYFNIYDGATLARTGTYGVNNNVHMPYSEDIGQLNNCQGRAPDSTLNLYGGAFTNAYLFLVGHNGGSSTINLHGGVLNCENITHIKYAKGSTDNTTYRIFNNKEGVTRIYWNGGTFMPNSAKTANDPLASDANNATLGGLTEVLVSTNGAVLSTSTLVADTYTIAQPLLHDPALEGESDGGLTVRGNAAKTVALTGANTYTGDTVVEAGTLSIPVGADASALPPGSAIVVAEGATLEMAAGTAARAGGLRVEMGTQSGTLAGFAPATQGTLYVDGVGDATRKGLVLPVTVTDAQVKHNLSRWPVVIDGEVDEKVCGRVRDNTIVLESKGGLVLTIR